MRNIKQLTFDNTTPEKKIAVLKKMGYHNKNRWLNIGGSPLELGFESSNLMFAPKILIETGEGFDKEYEQSIVCEHYKFEKHNDTFDNFLYSIVYNFPSKIERYINDDSVKKEYEYSSAAYLLTTIERKSLLNFYMLFRYDACQLNPHHNDFETVKKYLTKEQFELYASIFPEKIDPKMAHFHFTDQAYISQLNKNTGVSNGIDIESLENYLINLKNTTDENDLINKNDFCMPYLTIKKHPYLYTTSSENLGGGLNNMIKKINRSISRVDLNKSSNNTLIGIDAVIYDLIILKVLHELNMTGGGGTGRLLSELFFAQKIASGGDEFGPSFFKGHDGHDKSK